jgi:HAD superfamily hydrolase (TIGR01459 family)
MQFIKGLDQIIDNYQYFILDIWGVVHDGSSLYPDVLNALKYLKEKNKKICFLSNAPRRSIKVKQILNNLGINDNLYDFILSSGESTNLELLNNQKNNYQLFGKKYFYIGPDKDLDLLDDLAYDRVDKISEANFILNTGFENEQSKLEEKLSLAIEGVNYKIPMLCANPDLIVVKQNGNQMICAGALAIEYKNLGGQVHYFGKPYKRVYQMVFEKFSKPDKSTVLAIGDGLETDIKGAIDYGIDSVLVTGGILAKDLEIDFWQDCDPNKLKKICDNYNVIPKFVISTFKI